MGQESAVHQRLHQCDDDLGRDKQQHEHDTEALPHEGGAAPGGQRTLCDEVHLTSEFALADKMGYLSFERNSLYMTDVVVATVNLYDGNGNPLALVNGDEIEIEVDTEASTAIEGTDF